MSYVQNITLHVHVLSLPDFCFRFLCQYDFTSSFISIKRCFTTLTIFNARLYSKCWPPKFTRCPFHCAQCLLNPKPKATVRLGYRCLWYVLCMIVRIWSKYETQKKTFLLPVSDLVKHGENQVTVNQVTVRFES